MDQSERKLIENLKNKYTMIYNRNKINNKTNISSSRTATLNSSLLTSQNSLNVIKEKETVSTKINNNEDFSDYKKIKISRKTIFNNDKDLSFDFPKEYKRLSTCLNNNSLFNSNNKF